MALRPESFQSVLACAVADAQRAGYKLPAADRHRRGNHVRRQKPTKVRPRYGPGSFIAWLGGDLEPEWHELRNDAAPANERSVAFALLTQTLDKKNLFVMRSAESQ